MDKDIVSKDVSEFQLISSAIGIIHKISALCENCSNILINPHLSALHDEAKMWNQQFIRFVSNKQGGK